MVDNPFLADRGQQIAMALMSLGGGISQAASAGLPAWSGIGPGTANFASAMAMAQQRQRDQQQQDELLDLRRRSMGLQEQELSDKRAERDRLTKAAESYLPPGMGGPTAAPGVPGMRAPTPLSTMGPGSDVLSRAGNAIAGIESAGQPNGGYGAVGPETGKGRAYGKYQVMDFNVGPWTQEALGKAMTPQEFLANPEAQDAVFKAKFGQYTQQYGSPDAAARVWFGGPGALNNPGAKDVLGTTVDGYADRFNRSFGGSPPSIAPAQANGSTSGVAQPPQAPPLVPRPQLPAEDAARLTQAVRMRQITPQQADAEASRIIGDLHNRQQTMATEGWKQQVENWRFNRGLETEGEYVRGADGIERFVPKSGRSAGMPRYDKPKDAGTAEGDIALLGSAKPDSREYLAAYNRVRGRMIDGPGGIKYVPDMSAYDAPTFVAPNAAPQAAPAAGAGTTAAAPPGMTPIEGEKKYTESQGKDHTYALRLDNAIPLLEELVRKDDGTYSTDRLPSSYERTKASSKFVPDSMVSERAKEFRGVVNDIITATLRRESGATIQPSEFDTEYAKFIPQAGDNDKEIRRKLTALKIAARSIAEGSGRPMANYKNLVGGDAPASGTVAPIRIDMTGRRQ